MNTILDNTEDEIEFIVDDELHSILDNVEYEVKKVDLKKKKVMIEIDLQVNEDSDYVGIHNDR